MENKRILILSLVALLTIITLVISLGNLFYVATMVVEEKIPASYVQIYNKIFNLIDYIRVVFNPPVWEQKRYLNEKAPEENLETTTLPVFDLHVAEEDIHELNALLPKNPAFYRNWPQAYIKKWVPAVFQYEGKSYDVEIRYRGLNWWHWRVPKKSMRIKFPRGTAFFGVRRINLISPKTLIPFSQVIEHRLAEYLGLLSPNTYMAHVRLNGRYYGIMFAFDQPDKFFLEANNRPVGDIYGEKGIFVPLFNDAKYWEKYSSFDEEDPDNLKTLERFISVLNIKDRAKFKRVIQETLDMDMFYRWYAHSMILGSTHQDSTHNIRLYYDPVKRKFEFIPWDVLIMNSNKAIDTVCNKVEGKILSYTEFGHQKNRVLWDIVKDDRILAGILDLIDELDNACREDTFCDKDRGGWEMKNELTEDPIKYFYRYSRPRYEEELGLLKNVFMKRFDLIRRMLGQCKILSYITKQENEYFLNIVSFGRIGFQAENLQVQFTDGSKKNIPLNIPVFAQRIVKAYSGNKDVLFFPNRVSLSVDIFGETDKAKKIKKVRLEGHNIITGKTKTRNLKIYEERSDPGMLEGYQFRNIAHPAYESTIFSEGSLTDRHEVIHFKKGVHEIKNNLVIDADNILQFDPGTRMVIYPGVSVIVYGGIKAEGTADDPIIVEGKDGESWGAFIIDGSNYQDNIINHCIFKNGSEADIDGARYTGMLSIHNAGAAIANSVFERARGDDAINAKYSSAVIKDCVFRDNLSDAIDYDFCKGTIKYNTFSNNADDSIDFSFSTTHVVGNTISGSGDKGISVGENTHIVLKDLTISGCAIGIAVKDSSSADIVNCTIFNNRKGIALYQKKPNFKGGTAKVVNSTIKDNQLNIVKDEFSTISLDNSNIEVVDASRAEILGEVE